MILMRYETAGYFGIGFRRKYGLGAFARVSSPNAADVERRTAAVTLQGGVAFFAFQCFDSDGCIVLGFVSGDVGYHFPFFGRYFFYIVIEMRDGDASVFIYNLSQQAAEGVNGIGNSSSEVTGVEVAVGMRHDKPEG